VLTYCIAQIVLVQIDSSHFKHDLIEVRRRAKSADGPSTEIGVKMLTILTRWMSATADYLNSPKKNSTSYMDFSTFP
jgi:hypothetical protein